MPLKPVKPGAKLELRDRDAKSEGVPRGEEAVARLNPLLKRLAELQVALYAEAKRALLVVLQGRDASGKDGVVRDVFGPLNPQGCVVTSFRRPTELELSHDYLWRVHQAVPPHGTIGIFNRSHYEDVLVVRVHNLVPRADWSRRYDQINGFEKLLTENGVVLLKFFLHVSRDEQKERLVERLKDPLKNWKFQEGDLKEHDLWDDYTEAYQDALSRCSTPWAPWYLVPADRRTSRDLLITERVVQALEEMNSQFPVVDPAVLKIAKKWEREVGEGKEEG